MATVWIQQGVYLDLRPEMIDGLQKIKTLFKIEKRDLYITSGTEGDHQMNSFHYSGRAIDIRKATGITKKMIEQAVKPGFDVIPYDWGFHIEWDPK